MLSPEALLGIGSSTMLNKKNRINKGNLAAIREEVKAAGKRTAPQNLKYRPQSHKDDSNNSLQVLLTMKQVNQ